MDRGRQPNIWRDYNTGRMANEALARDEQQRRVQELKEVLDSPDRMVKHPKSIINNKNDMIGRLQLILSVDHNLHTYMNYGYGEEIIDVMFFDPHEIMTDDTDVIPISMDYSTSVVALNIYKDSVKSVRPADSAEPKVGNVILFAMSATMSGESTPELAVHDLCWGDNCVYGAIIKDGKIKWFKMTYSDNERVVSELRRKDSTEDSGESVDARVVSKGVSIEYLKEIDPNSDVAVELEMELDKFLESRKSQD